jgi:hypothetical protein
MVIKSDGGAPTGMVIKSDGGGDVGGGGVSITTKATTYTCPPSRSHVFIDVSLSARTSLAKERF